MRAGAFMAGEGFARLRRQIAEIEGRPDWRQAAAGGTEAVIRDPSVLPFGVAALDQRLRGGLRRDALHEFRSETTRHAAAVTGFAAAILARLTTDDRRPVLWIMEEAAGREAGGLYGPGFDHFGLDSKRLIIVVTRKPGEALWVFEEGLRCAGLAVVLAELRGHPRSLDLTASRRLALRAREHGVMGLLLRQAARAEPGAAATRWCVAPRPAATLDDFEDGIGRPVWQLTLERNRAGTTGAFDLEWDHARHAFAPARPALSVPRPSLSPDRPDLARAAGAVVAFHRAVTPPRWGDAAIPASGRGSG